MVNGVPNLLGVCASTRTSSGLQIAIFGVVGWWLCPTELSGYGIMVGQSRHPTDFRPQIETHLNEARVA